jgi:hypothetical protein
MLIEVDEEHRRLCKPPPSPSPLFLCSARQIGFSQNQDEIQERFNEEQDCKPFVKWNPGFPPKEHKEMRMSEELLQHDQDWREGQAKLQEEWRRQDMERQSEREREQAERDRRWRQEDIRRTRWDIAVKVIGPIIAALVGVILGWFLHR